MTKIQKIALSFLLIVMLSFYAFWMQTNAKKPINIQPITIEAIDIKEVISSPKESIPTQATDILSRLKVASTASKEGIVPSIEELSKNVLQSLTKEVSQQKVEAVAIKKKVPTIEKTVPQKIIRKKVVVKQIVVKKVIAKKILIKKMAHKKEPNAKLLSNVSKVTLPKKTGVIIDTESTEQTLSQNNINNGLSREAEVALYKNKYATTLEVLNVSKNFEIKEESTLPDSHYFEPIVTSNAVDKNAPLAFVEKLGLVRVSDNYESNFTVSKKVEVAKEGIVSFSSASIETEEMKNLKFVDTLGVIEVSKDFETTEAKKHLD